MKSKLVALLMLFSPLMAEQVSSEEIRVYLSTTSPLQPLYLGKLHSTDQSFDSNYLSQLYSVLAFDLNYNGSTRVLATHGEREEELKAASFNVPLWKSWGAAYVIKCEVQNKSLNISFLSSKTGALKKFPPMALSGSLSKDRKNLHRLSDSLHKTLFGKEGIASTKIIYTTKVRKDDKYVSEVWCCDWDGANAKEITHENHLCVTPVFLPPSAQYSNDRFLYVSFKQGKSKIYIGSLSQTTGKRLIDLNGNQMLPAISPQRNKIAFITDVSGRTDLFMQEFHPETGEMGKPVQLFSYPRSTQASPTFNADGSKIAFVSDKDGSPRIYILPAALINEKRGIPTLLTKKNLENSCPSWSPDGKKIAFSAKTKGTRQIWIYDFDTGQEWQLTDGTGNKENPSWAPDSQHLVFNSTDGHTSELYLVNLNQPDVVKITSGPGIKHYPSWGTK
jgi:TolB protein